MSWQWLVHGMIDRTILIIFVACYSADGAACIPLALTTRPGSLGPSRSSSMILSPALALSPTVQLPLSANRHPSLLAARALGELVAAMVVVLVLRGPSGGVSRPRPCCRSRRRQRCGTKVRYMVSRKCLVVPKVKRARAPGNALGISRVRFSVARAALTSGDEAAAARAMSVRPVIWMMALSTRKILCVQMSISI